jgi:hypothetical protein
MIHLCIHVYRYEMTLNIYKILTINIVDINIIETLSSTFIQISSVYGLMIALSLNDNIHVTTHINSWYHPVPAPADTREHPNNALGYLFPQPLCLIVCRWLPTRHHTLQSDESPLPITLVIAISSAENRGNLPKTFVSAWFAHWRYVTNIFPSWEIVCYLLSCRSRHCSECADNNYLFNY